MSPNILHYCQEETETKGAMKIGKNIYIYISVICISIYKQQLQLVAGKQRTSSLPL